MKHTHTYTHTQTQVLREKLLYAIHHSSAIDTDFRVRGDEMLDGAAGEDSVDMEYFGETEEEACADEDVGIPFTAELTGD